MGGDLAVLYSEAIHNATNSFMQSLGTFTEVWVGMAAKFYYWGDGKYELRLQWVPQLFKRLGFFHVNKSCKIECCGNKTHQIIQNMILSQGLEL